MSSSPVSVRDRATETTTTTQLNFLENTEVHFNGNELTTVLHIVSNFKPGDYATEQQHKYKVCKSSRLVHNKHNNMSVCVHQLGD